MQEGALKRTVSLPALTLYSLGTMIGAGFYALLGEVAAIAGPLAPWSFLAACVTALFAVLTYAEFVTRYPRSGGIAIYAQHAFQENRVGAVVGWATMATGIISAAALTHAFAGYLGEFVSVPDWLVFPVFTLALGGLAAWGISQSVAVVVSITLIEVGGLLLVAGVVIASGDWQGAGPVELLPSLSAFDAGAILVGGFLSLYAFIGFEDVVNVAEEAHRPKYAMPRAMVYSLAVTALLYIGVSLIAVLAVAMPDLEGSKAPLADVVRGGGAGWALLIGLVGMLAGINGALVQVVMASRVLYGMAREDMGPSWFDAVNPRTRTPVRATLLVTVIVLVLALAFNIVTLAGITSFIILVLFAVLHVGLLRLKRRAPHSEGALVLPGWVQLAGLATIAVLLLARGVSLFL